MSGEARSEYNIKSRYPHLICHCHCILYYQCHKSIYGIMYHDVMIERIY